MISKCAYGLGDYKICYLFYRGYHFFVYILKWLSMEMSLRERGAGSRERGAGTLSLRPHK